MTQYNDEDRLIDEARQTFYTDKRGREFPPVDEVPHSMDWYYEPSVEERKAHLVADLKKLAPDWDEMTVREIIHLMAMSKVVFAHDDKPWVKPEAAQ